MKIKLSDIGYNEIKDQASIDKFVELSGGIQDSIIKEFRTTESAFISSKESVYKEFKLNGQLLIHSNWSKADIEILFAGIKKISWTHIEEIYSGNFKISKSNLETVSLLLDSEFKIEANRIYYRLMNKDSNIPIFGESIPDDEMTVADKLNDNWIQCQNCSESWISIYHIDKCTGCGEIVNNKVN